MEAYAIISKKPNPNGRYKTVTFAYNEKVVPIFLTKEEAKKALNGRDIKKYGKIVKIDVFIREYSHE